MVNSKLSPDSEITVRFSTGNYMSVSHGRHFKPHAQADVSYILDGRFDSGQIEELLRSMVYPAFDVPENTTIQFIKEASRWNEEIDSLFHFYIRTQQLDIDLGGFEVQILDQKAFVAHLAKTRPKVFGEHILEEMNEELRNVYESHSS